MLWIWPVTHTYNKVQYSFKSEYFFKIDKTYYLYVCKINTSEVYDNSVTGYILYSITKGLFIVVLQDKYGRCTHTIGIDRILKVIYECMEKHELQLNYDNLSKYCGPNVVFERFVIVADLKDIKVNEKNLKIK